MLQALNLHSEKQKNLSRQQHVTFSLYMSINFKLLLTGRTSVENNPSKFLSCGDTILQNNKIETSFNNTNYSLNCRSKLKFMLQNKCPMYFFFSLILSLLLIIKLKTSNAIEL